MIIDLHTHTSEHSPCSQQTAIELIRRAAKVGLDGVVITDHDYLWSAQQLAMAAARAGVGPLRVFRGQEVTCIDGHLLVFGIEESLPGDEPRAAVARRVRAQGGATVLPHPFRWQGYAMEPDESVAVLFREYDAIEGWTTNHSEAEQRRARRFRGVRGIRLTGASDAHGPDRVGAYATRVDGQLQSDAELVNTLRSGRLVPVRREATGVFRACP